MSPVHLASSFVDGGHTVDQLSSEERVPAQHHIIETLRLSNTEELTRGAKEVRMSFWGWELRCVNTWTKLDNILEKRHVPHFRFLLSDMCTCETSIMLFGPRIPLVYAVSKQCNHLGPLIIVLHEILLSWHNPRVRQSLSNQGKCTNSKVKKTVV